MSQFAFHYLQYRFGLEDPYTLGSLNLHKEVSITAIEKVSKDPENPGDAENDWKTVVFWRDN